MQISVAGYGWEDGWSSSECRINRNIVYGAGGCSMFTLWFAVEESVGGKRETAHGARSNVDEHSE